jgi:hypothetical protein
MSENAPIVINQPPHPGDHDLLIRLDEKMDGVKTDIKDLKDGLSVDVQHLKTDKLDREEFETFKNEDFAEVRDDVKTLSRYVWMAIGALALFNLYLAYKQAFPNSPF